MNISTADTYTGSSLAAGIARFLWGNPGAFKQTVDNEMRLQNRNPNDPEQGPRKERGDIYIMVGAIAGMLAGGLTGGLIGNAVVNTSGVVIGAIAGVIIGGLLGTSIGNHLKNKKNNSFGGSLKKKNEGPFIR